jgi:hypothetical protein
MPTATENKKIGVQYDNVRAAFVPTSYNEGERTIEVTFATETPYRRRTWDGEYDEILSLKKSHVRMDRLKKGAPFLADHSGWNVRNVLGVVEKAWIDEETKSGRALIRFSEREDVKPILQDIKTGILRNVSVGYRVYKFEKEPAPEKSTAPPVYRATDWEPHEVSLVAIPADANSQVRAAETGGENDCIIEFNQTEERNMEINNPVTPHVTPPVVDEAALKAKADAAILEERTRGIEIRKTTKIAQLDDAFADDVIGRGVTLDQARALIFDELAKRQAQQQPPTNPHHQGNVGGEDNELRAIEQGMLHRAAPETYKAEGKAQDFRFMSLVDIARLCLEKKGVNARSLPIHEVVSRAISTSDYPILTQNIANKFLRRGYDEAPVGEWKKLATRTTSNDFKAKTGIQYDGAYTFDEIPEGGEYQLGYLKEAKETLKLGTYGKLIALTRQAIINDDLGGFTKHASRMGRGYAEKQAELAWNLLTKNSGNGMTMGDGFNLFDGTNHKNVGTTGAISETTLTEALRLMRMQKGLDTKQYLNLRPSYLVVTPKREIEARKIINGLINPTQTSNVNMFVGSMQIIVEPRLQDTDEDRWYVTADPMQIDMLGWAELAGAEGLFMEQKETWNTDGIEWKARGDFGITVWDWRGFFKNEGA